MITEYQTKYKNYKLEDIYNSEINILEIELRNYNLWLDLQRLLINKTLKIPGGPLKSLINIDRVRYRFHLLKMEIEAYSKSELNIELEICNKGELNARAEINPNRVIIDEALICCIENYFSHLVACSKHFSKEAIDGEVVECKKLIFNNSDDLMEVLKEIGVARYTSGERFYISKLFEYAAIDFILLHEMAHIYHGHRGFELFGNPRPKFQEKQALEMDADGFAAAMMCTIWKKNGAKFLTTLSHHANNNILDKWLGENGGDLFLAMTAYFALTRLDVQYGWNYADLHYATQRHPPMTIRRIFAFSHLSVWVEKHLKAVNKPFLFVEQAMANGEMLYCDFLKEDFDGLRREWLSKADIMEEYLVELNEIREKILPDLREFQLGPRFVKINASDN